MNFKVLKSLLFAVLCGICAFGATAATPIFSDYGQIQNVQYYSTNPFWTPNSPYNKRMPQPVYVQGADLNTEDCMNVVQSLVYVQCLARDNCRDTSLSDIRPTIMVQLSNLPGNNYVSACAGYIDGAYDAFVKQYGNSIPNRAVAFPDATVPNQNIQNINTSPQQYNQNSYQPTNNKKTPDWQSAINERTQELIELQKQNGADSYNLSATDFPATVEDLSFASQVALKTDGYEPFMGKHAYTLPTIKGQDEFCKKYPDDPRCPQKETKETKEVREGPREKPREEPREEHEQEHDQEHRQEHEQEHRQEEENADTYYTLRICNKIAFSSHQCTSSSPQSFKCYAVCGQTLDDDVNTKVLTKILEKKYCTPEKVKVGSSDEYVMQDESGNTIKINKEQVLKIIPELNKLKDSGKCEWNGQNIDAYIYKHENGNSVLYKKIRLDD